MDIKTSIKRFITSIPERYKTSDDTEIELDGCLLEIDDNTLKSKKFERIIL